MPELVEHRDLFYGGAWHAPQDGARGALFSPGDGQSLGHVARAGAADVDLAVAAARQAFPGWRDTEPRLRADALRKIAALCRSHAHELAMIDAADCGNPVSALLHDAEIAASGLEFFAGLVTEMKGASIPMGRGHVNYSVREPLGVVAKLNPFNHPFMFCAFRAAAPLAAGNCVIVKPPEQAPLSSLRIAELIAEILPSGVFSVLPGGREAGARLAAHPQVAKVSLIGSVTTGKAVLHAAADTIKPALLELGGKNALIAYPDADPAEVAAGIVAGMNFAWCGQSCGSTSRAFVHDAIHDEVVAQVAREATAYRPGLPTDPATTMGALIDRQAFERVSGFIASAHAEGARLVCGGGRPADASLANGYYIEPTVFADVHPDMRIAREEIFGPVLSILRWSDEAAMLRDVNDTDYGLTCSIWTEDLNRAHRTAAAVEAGYVWINGVSRHFLGAPFGGYKMSGMGREECLEELLAYTSEKNINITLRDRRTGGPA